LEGQFPFFSPPAPIGFQHETAKDAAAFSGMLENFLKSRI
jgi:hypothetical protein